MSTHTLSPAPAVTVPGPRPWSRAQTMNAYWQEARCEVRRYLRSPGFMLPVLLFPLMFYLLFGIMLNHAPQVRQLLLSSYLCFGVMSPGLYGFGVSMAMERDNGLLQLKRVQPAPAGAYLVGKLVMAILVGLLVGGLMLVLGIVVAGVDLGLGAVVRTLLLSGLGVIPFAALGLYLGSWLKGQGGAGLINLVYLPMAVLSGLWFPLSLLPHGLQQIAPLWPASHLDQLALWAMGLSAGPAWPHALILLGYTAIFTGWAMRRLQAQG